LLYQVAMAGLSPAEIAAPIRSLLRGARNVSVRQEQAIGGDLARRVLRTRADGHEREHAFDYLLLACGAAHAYFGHAEWEEHAPGLKTLEQAVEIRRRVLSAYERAELEPDRIRQRALLTFVVVGGGPTGVELAGALGEMSRFTLARDFRRIDPALARVILVEAGPRILPSFPEALARRATRDLEALGVQVWTGGSVTRIDAGGVEIGRERIETATALWAAGVKASALGAALGLETDRQGRVVVGPDLAVPGHPAVFVLGDQAHARGPNGAPLPGLAPVAMQAGRFAARAILAELAGRARGEFRYEDRGQLATIGRSRAIGQIGRVHFAGLFAWLVWLFVHIYFLVGFRNRLLVVLQWAWSYWTYDRGARLIVSREWREHRE
ncbi:MAG TPA: NAD(P)/FAD-dependent oxidoreductase, partial [Myxococcota bacterium]|nr:NAD(P)/FAD-dependent oxidoreductase [Myxococcota bacterium]